MEAMTQDYEILFLLSPNENVYNESISKIKKLFEENKVKITSEDKMGKKVLGYAVKKNTQGHYHLFNIKIEGKLVKILSDEMRLFEDVLKFMFVKKEKKFIKKTDNARKQAS